MESDATNPKQNRACNDKIVLFKVNYKVAYIRIKPRCTSIRKETLAKELPITCKSQLLTK